MQARTTLTAPGYAAAGAAALGWITAMPHGPGAALRTAAAAPAIALGLAAGLTPALYIGLTLTRAETGPRRFAAAVARALRAGGLAALALAGPLLFLAATASAHKTPELLGALCLATAAGTGLAVLGRGAAARYQPSSKLCFALWSLAAVAIAASLLSDAVVWGTA